MTWIFFVILCGFGGELPLGTVCPEFFLESWEFHGAIRAVGVFWAKSRSDVIALQFYRPRSQLQKASVHHKINYFTGSWDLGSISRNVLATAMREVQEAFEFEHFGMRKDTVWKDGRAIVLYIVRNSGMFCMSSLFTDCICFVRVCYTTRIYIYIYIYPSIWVYTSPFRGLTWWSSDLMLFLWCLMARDNWVFLQCGPHATDCVQPWDSWGL